MPLAHRTDGRRLLALTVSALVLGFACRTSAPDEHYYDGTHTQSGGPQSTSGGSSTQPPLPPSSGAGSSPEAGGAPSGEGSTSGEGGLAFGPSTGDAGAPNAPPPSSCEAPAIADGPFSKEALRRSAFECARFQLCEFEGAATSLDAAVQAHAADPSADARDAARSAWTLAMSAWSRLELFQFGPLASRATSAGKDGYLGEGLRDPIYGWPSVARCRVEDQVASLSFVDKGMGGVLTSARGLYALEYLLFYAGADSSCAATSTTAQSFETFSGEELGQRKTDYALALADDIRARASALSQTYAPGAAFESAFVDASGYPSEQESLNVLGWALVYIEREVKDYKLGVPAGYTLTHPVQEAESPYAGVGTDNLRQNLLGFRALFQGCGPAGEGTGFDDWLIAAGHPDLASDVIAAWNDALSAVDAFPALEAATTAEVQALYAKFKALTDLLKAELFGDGSPLGLKLPASLEGDTD